MKEKLEVVKNVPLLREIILPIITEEQRIILSDLVVDEGTFCKICFIRFDCEYNKNHHDEIVHLTIYKNQNRNYESNDNKLFGLDLAYKTDKLSIIECRENKLGKNDYIIKEWLTPVVKS